MKNLMFYNSLNEFSIDRKELLGKGATGEVYAGNYDLIQANLMQINLR